MRSTPLTSNSLRDRILGAQVPHRGHRFAPHLLIAALLTLILVLFTPLLPRQATQPTALFTLALMTFLTPGLRMARLFESELNVTFLTIAFFISYALYAGLALL